MKLKESSAKKKIGISYLAVPAEQLYFRKKIMLVMHYKG